MVTSWARRVGIAAVVLGLLGCAEERDPINRVQPNAVAKSFFVGADLRSASDDPEFYMRGSIVDVGYGAAHSFLFTATFTQNVSRIKWEITEDLLIARITYERIQGSDGKGSPDTNDGQVAAMYRIETHFDIRREYNPATGEETNVVVENGSDRPWHDREYMRVDWSRNLFTDAYDFDTLSLLGVYGGIQYQPVAYYVNDPVSEDAPFFDAQNGYFDVTNKAFATPKIIDLSSFGWGIAGLPACFLDPDFLGGSAPSGNCNPVEITVRQSFKRVVDKDYEPIDWDGQRMDMFGVFTADRMGYDRNYGMVDQKWHRFATRYNLWERSHAYADPATMTGAVPCNVPETTPPGEDPQRDWDRDGTHDECQTWNEDGSVSYGRVVDTDGSPLTPAAFVTTGPGSRCDPHRRACTLPYTKRTSVTIPWYFGPDSDENLWDVTEQATAEWDLAMRMAVQSARYTECRRTWGRTHDLALPGNLAEVPAAVSERCAREYLVVDETTGARDLKARALADVPPIFVLCHNPVRAGDHAACGPPGVKARIGDLRFNSVNVIEKPQSPSPWGIYVDAEDPLTGEKVATSVNVWNHVNDLAAQGLVDSIKHANGEITSEDVIRGSYNHPWISGSDDKREGQALLEDARIPTLAPEEVERRLAALDRSLEPEQPVAVPGHIHSKEAFERFAMQNLRTRFGETATGKGNADIHSRLASFRGSAQEIQLTTEPWLTMAGLDPALPVDASVLDQASPLRGNGSRLQVKLARLKENALAARGACMMQAPEPTTTAGMARAMKAKFPLPPDASPADVYERDRRMHDYIRRKLHYAVILHEMGHSVGLRHNFVSTYDAMNFRPQYWQLRTANGAVKTTCAGQVADGSTCVGPRWEDPLTQDEIDGMIWMWQHTTVMDYPGDLAQDFLGLSAYDFAAARFFYGDVVDVWTDVSGDGTPIRKNSKHGHLLRERLDSFGGIGGPWYVLSYASTADFRHYSQLHNELNLIQDCQPVEAKAPAGWDAQRDGEWHATLDGLLVRVNGEYRVCREHGRDQVAYEMLDPDEPEAFQGGARVKKFWDANAYYGVDYEKAGDSQLRVPYMFASDEYADIGNAAVFRHDNGADPYEQFLFWINRYENGHIFDNYRRNRSAFSIRGAVSRATARYNEKMMEATKGFALWHDLVTGLGLTSSYYGAKGALMPNALAASMAFDHFTRILARPASGSSSVITFLTGDKLVQHDDLLDNPSPAVHIPDGSTGYIMKDKDGNVVEQNVSFGGRPLHNALDQSKGYWSTQYQRSAGSYYHKTEAIYHLANAEDHFISQSLEDFVDGRYRNLNFGNIFPEGLRRVLASLIADDPSALGPRVEVGENGLPIVEEWPANDPDYPHRTWRYPRRPMGWVSFWPPQGPEVCWPRYGTNVCRAFTNLTNPPPVGSEDPPAAVATVDPVVGWEVQKFAIFWGLTFLPTNWKMDYVDLFRVYRVGADQNPDFDEAVPARVEWRDPTSGTLYVAKHYGLEKDVNGRDVHRGIGARALAWANLLTARAYQPRAEPECTAAGATYDQAAKTCTTEHGQLLLAHDPATYQPVPKPGGMELIARLKNYKSVIDYMRQISSMYGFDDALQRGLDGN